MLSDIQSLLESNLQVILTGAPGTGKTYTARKVACEVTGDDLDAEEQPHVQSVQFHPGYDYSDFVVGMKPKPVGKTVSFEWEDGIFKKFADKAKDDPDHKYVFLIDEINRADLSRVFGELFSLLEEEYRYPNNKKGITLPNGKVLHIPENLYIIGTMNDIDRSVESMDFALRRRFAWYEVKAEQSENIIDRKADEGKITREAAGKLTNAMRAINGLIAPSTSSDGGAEPKTDFRLGAEYQLGGAIFAKFEKYSGDVDPFGKLWENHIANILSEYLRGRRDRGEQMDVLRKAYDNAIEKGEEERRDDSSAFGKDTKFKVICPGGEINEKTGAASLCAFVRHIAEQFGMERIVELGIGRSKKPGSKPLLVKDDEFATTRKGDYDSNSVMGYHVLTKSDGWQKRKQIQEIIDGLRLGAEYKVIDA